MSDVYIIGGHHRLALARPRYTDLAQDVVRVFSDTSAELTEQLDSIAFGSCAMGMWQPCAGPVLSGATD